MDCIAAKRLHFNFCHQYSKPASEPRILFSTEHHCARNVSLGLKDLCYLLRIPRNPYLTSSNHKLGKLLFVSIFMYGYRATLTSYHLHDLLMRVMVHRYRVHPEDPVSSAKTGTPSRTVLLHRLHVDRIVTWNIVDESKFKQTYNLISALYAENSNFTNRC